MISLLTSQKIKNLFMTVVLICQVFTASSCEKEIGTTKTVNPLTTVSLIPIPQSINYGSENIAVPNEITVSNNLNGIPFDLLSGTIKQSLGISSISRQPNETSFIKLNIDSSLPDEGYKLNINDKGIVLSYKSDKGLLWGVQTLRQILLQHSTNGKGLKTIPLMTLTDNPVNDWRGFHIDVARHMFTIDYLKKVVDMLSFYKINKLQLHLTDDQGWRIEIKQYPKLTTIGGWREFDEYDKECISLSKTDPDFTIDSRFIRNNNEYGGYYTQAQLKELIDYTIERGIEVIPEIDMPGHFSAGIKAYPELSCTGEAGWGEEFSFPVCASKESTYTFMKNVLEEVTALFPGKYIHIGADEVETDIWKQCEQCTKFIKDNNLKDVHGLWNYFVQQMADHLKSKGMNVMAWDDAFLSSKPQDITYTYWRDWISDNPGKITQQGYKMIFMEWGNFYLSAKPSDNRLKALYEFNPNDKFSGIVRSNMLGYQACVWTEIIPNEKKLGQHIFPSLQAFSELSWSENKRNWDSFTNRLPWHLNWLTTNGIHSRKPGFVN